MKVMGAAVFFLIQFYLKQNPIIILLLRSGKYELG